MENKGKTIVCLSIVFLIFASVLYTGKIGALWALFFILFIWEME